MAAAVGITPDQFWGLTPHELKLYVQGIGERRDDDMEALAWLQANIMNVWASKGKRVKASDLYRRRRARRPEFSDAESFKAYMRERQRARDEEG